MTYITCKDQLRISPYYALDRRPAYKGSDIVMAGLNARGLQSKLLITPLSSEAIIIIIILQVWCSIKSLHVLWAWLQ